MKDKLSVLPIALLFATTSLAGQIPVRSAALADENSDGGSYRPASTVQQGSVYGGPFSRFAIGGNFNTFGPGVQITTNVVDHVNVRASGSALYYSTNFNTNGFDAHAKMNMATAGIAADVYPFLRHGFRVSPGVLFVNNNRINATAIAAGGTSIDFNDTTYYSATARRSGESCCPSRRSRSPPAGATRFPGTAGIGPSHSRLARHSLGRLRLTSRCRDGHARTRR